MLDGPLLGDVELSGNHTEDIRPLFASRLKGGGSLKLVGNEFHNTEFGMHIEVDMDDFFRVMQDAKLF